MWPGLSCGQTSSHTQKFQVYQIYFEGTFWTLFLFSWSQIKENKDMDFVHYITIQVTMSSNFLENVYRRFCEHVYKEVLYHLPLCGGMPEFMFFA